MIQVVEDGSKLCPDILYKYRKWDENGKKVLTDCQLYLARPDSFEDEYDCNPIIEPLSFEEFCLFTYHKLKENNPMLDDHRLIIETEKLWHTSPMRDLNLFQKEVDRLRHQFSDVFGVLSMTEIPDNPFMWNEYGDNHTGFCIGIDGKEIAKLIGGGGSVIYDDEIPHYKFGTISNDEQIEITILHKHSKYKNEKEYRATKMQDHPYSEEERIIHFPGEAVKTIYLGKNMPNECKQEVYQIAKTNFPKANLIEL